MGFESLDQAIKQDIVLTEQDLAFADQELSDEAALSIVKQDVAIAEQYLQSKSLALGIDVSDDLYRAYVQPRQWPNGIKRSNISMPVVLEAVEKILPALHMALWGSKDDPFYLVPKGKTTPDAARAKGKILSWAIKEAGLKEEMRRSLKTALLHGFMVGHWGWETTTKQIKKYKRGEDGKIKPEIETVEINKPTYKCLNLRKVLVDPACDTHDVRKSAKYVIIQTFITANDLDDLRDDAGYKNVPTRDELSMILVAHGEPSVDSLLANKTNSWRDMQAETDAKPTSIDPLQQPLEILEYWTDDRVITVLQRKIVIRNEANEFGKKTQVSCSFIDVLGSAWGFGIAKLLAGEQRFQVGVRNMWIDSLTLQLNPVFQMLKGMGAGSQQITVSPGKIITETGELKPLFTPSVSTESMNAINHSDDLAKRLVGANGGSGLPDQAMRTAQGINAYAGDVIQRLQYFLEIFIDTVFVPTLEAFVEMCTDKLEPQQINDILTEAEGKAYQGDILEVYNASCDIGILAGTKLTTKAAAAQLLPMLVQLVTTQPFQDSLLVQGNKFDYTELLKESLDLMGWDINSLIVPMTPADQQRAQAQNQAVIEAQTKMALQQQQHQNDLENINEKGTVQAGVAIVKQTVKGHLDEAQSVLENGLGGTNGQ